MNVEEFLEGNQIPKRTCFEDSESEKEENTKIVCALRCHSDESIFFEFNGTVYEARKDDVVDICSPEEPIVTKSGKGSPVCISFRAGALLCASRQVQASQIEEKLPFVLAQPSQAAGISIGQPITEHERKWFNDRNLDLPTAAQFNTSTDTFSNTNSSTMSTLWTDTTSPATWEGGLDDWRPDDSNRDGNHPDDNQPDDNYNDDVRNDDIG